MKNNEVHLTRYYSLRIEQQNSVLYHVGNSDEKVQRVVAQEELFGLLEKAHKKTGHGGILIMWNELRNFCGISKLAFS